MLQAQNHSIRLTILSGLISVYKMKFYEAQLALTSICEKLSAKGIPMSPRLLDHMIWNYQREQQ